MLRTKFTITEYREVEVTRSVETLPRWMELALQMQFDAAVAELQDVSNFDISSMPKIDRGNAQTIVHHFLNKHTIETLNEARD